MSVTVTIKVSISLEALRLRYSDRVMDLPTLKGMLTDDVEKGADALDILRMGFVEDIQVED